MNFDDYMKKIQNISDLLEKSKYAEDILNSKELDIAKDFQYICLSSASNYDLVNEVIARLAQNGNKNIVEENIKIISMNMWKDLFDKNEFTKEIFIQNFNTIYENTSIITFREIERFVSDADTYQLIYSFLGGIIKKLCTYDRASLISMLKFKPNGVEKIKENLENFFQKGDFDISTTYSKILYELSKIQEIEQIEILKACNKNLSEMLNRETAIDNETNKLLNWIYDAFEETKMDDNERYLIKKNIDNAILSNFDYILDKSNYDKNTIKVLKQFDCTKERFEKNKNHFIDKSNKLEKERFIDTTSNAKKYKIESITNAKKINEILENTKEQIEKENDNLKNIINDTEHNNIINSTENKLNNGEIKLNQKVNDNINMTSESLINSYIQKFNNKKTEQNDTKGQDEILDEKIKKLVVSNIEETNKIIDKVLKKNASINECNNLEYKSDNETNSAIVNNNIKNEEMQLQEKKEDNISTALIRTEESSFSTIEKKNIFKRIWEKIVRLFKTRSSIERIGE